MKINKLFIFGIVFLFLISFVSATDYYYDMGSSVIENGYTKVLQNTDYTDSTGFGWASAGSVTLDIDRTTPTNLKRDFSVLLETDSTAYTEFKQNLTTGIYNISIISGDENVVQCAQEIYFENASVGNTVQTDAGSFYNFTKSVNITDGILNIQVYKPTTCILEKHVRINAITITLYESITDAFELTLKNIYDDSNISNFTASFNEPYYLTEFLQPTILSSTTENNTQKEETAYTHLEFSDDWKDAVQLYLQADVNATSNKIYDWSQNKNNATVTGAVWNETTKAFDFNGVNDLFSQSKQIYFNNSQSYFLFVKMKQSSDKAGEILELDGGIRFEIISGYKLGIKSDVSPYYTTQTLNSNLFSNDLFFSAAFYFDGTGNISYYVNGTLIENKLIIGYPFSNGSFNVKIGGSSGSDYINGSLSKVIFLNQTPAGYTPDSLALCLHNNNCSDMFQTTGTQTLNNVKVNASKVTVNITDLNSVSTNTLQYRLTNGVYTTNWYDYLTNNTIDLNTLYYNMYPEIKFVGGETTGILQPYKIELTTNSISVIDGNYSVLNLTENATYNITFDADGFLSRTEYFEFNESKIFNLSAHELIYPTNNLTINDSRIVNFTYFVAQDLNNCYLYFNNSLMQSQNPVQGFNNFTHIFSGNGQYYWTVVCDGGYPVSNSFDVIEGIYAPMFMNYSPSNLSIMINEGESVSFSSDVDSPLDYSYNWFLDSVLQTIANVWTWITDFFDAGEHTVDLVINDSFGQNSTLSYNVTVLDVNQKPTVNSIAISPIYNAPNLNLTVYCNVTDDSNSSDLLIAEIEIKKGLFWTALATNYSEGNLFYSIIPANTYSTGDVLDVRCRATDVNDIPLTSDWFTINSAINYELKQTAPEKPSTLEPKFGNYKFIIPVLCTDSKDLESERQKMSYELSVSVNSSEYSLISNSSSFVAYSYNIYEDGYNTTYKFKCRGYDSIDYSEYSYTDLIVKKNIPVFELVELNEERTIVAGKPRQFTIYADLSALSSYKIIYTYIDCDNNGIWDAFTTFDSDKVDETYSCLFTEGLNEMKYGIIVEKTDDDVNWDGVCNSLDKSVDKCDYSKIVPVVAK